MKHAGHGVPAHDCLYAESFDALIASMSDLVAAPHWPQHECGTMTHSPAALHAVTSGLGPPSFAPPSPPAVVPPHATAIAIAAPEDKIARLMIRIIPRARTCAKSDGARPRAVRSSKSKEGG